jgi:hypothetical protein
VLGVLTLPLARLAIFEATGPSIGLEMPHLYTETAAAGAPPTPPAVTTTLDVRGLESTRSKTTPTPRAAGTIPVSRSLRGVDRSGADQPVLAHSELPGPIHQAVVSSDEVVTVAEPESNQSDSDVEPVPLSPTLEQAERQPPWQAAADAGVSLGITSKKAGQATASYFTRIGKRIAASF